MNIPICTRQPIKVSMRWSTDKWFILPAALLFIVVLSIELINGRFWLNDFKVYYLAAQAFSDADPLYGRSFGLSSGYYKYSPFSAMAYVPLSQLPYMSAAVAQFLLIVASIISGILFVKGWVVREFSSITTRRIFWPLLLSLLCIGVHYVRELHLGNVNALLLFGVCILIHSIVNDRDGRAGVILGVILLFKPYFLILGLPLLLSGRWSTLMSSGLTVLLLSLLTLLPHGWDYFITMHGEWGLAMLQHDVQLDSHQSIIGILQTYIGLVPSTLTSLAVIGVVSALLVLLHAQWRTMDASRRLVLLLFICTALIPSLFTTDTEHFLFAMPLIVLCILLLRRRRKWSLNIVFFILILLYGCHSTDLLGRDLAVEVLEAGVLGLADLGIICFSIVLVSLESNQVRALH